jgi:spore coat polysaccharide biosynthesis predicted glycosyltransferase SpsG
MRYVFRADASPEIGAGHVMRSSAVAEEFIRRGYSTIFVGDIQGIPWLFERIKELGFDKFFNHEKEFTSNPKKDVLILDSYSIDPAHSYIDKSKWLKIISIFDSVTPNYFCDMRIHPGLSNQWGNLPGVITLSGPTYIPIRKSLRVTKSNVESKPLRILIVGGGTDINNFGIELCRVLQKFELDFRATVIVGEQTQLNLDSRFSREKFGTNFDILVNDFDLVFTTASTISLELAAKGFVIGVGCSVSNQEIYFNKLIEMNLAMSIGSYKSKWIFDEIAISELIESNNLRISLRKNLSKVLDFQGASRIMKQILDISAIK